MFAVEAPTGGAEVTRVVLDKLPMRLPGIVITQNMPAAYT